MVYITIFGCIAATKDLISCDSLLNCKSFTDYIRYVIQSVTNEVIIDFDIKKFAAYINAAKRFTA